jgi:outer membrane protein assembly factor BamB
MDDGTNIVWQTEIGLGQSSPVVAGRRIYATAEPDRLLCLDLEKGRVVWQRQNGLATLPADASQPQTGFAAHRDCGYSTPTPVSDGHHVWATFGTGVVVCYDLDGNRQWIRLIDEKPVTEYGRTASPLLVGGKLVVTMSCLTALNARTGETIWQAAEAQAAYGTPAVARVGSTEVLVTPRGDGVRVSDGKILFRELGEMEFCSPLVHGDAVFFVGEPTLAWRLSERNGTIGPQRLWECDEVEGEFYASPVCVEGVLYCASNEGVLFALEAESGRLLYQQELELPPGGGDLGAEPANLYGSLALAGRQLLIANDRGEALVLAPGRTFQQLAHNFLDSGSGASPVADGQRLLLRGGRKLYCVGE